MGRGIVVLLPTGDGFGVRPVREVDVPVLSSDNSGQAGVLRQPDC